MPIHDALGLFDVASTARRIQRRAPTSTGQDRADRARRLVERQQGLPRVGFEHTLGIGEGEDATARADTNRGGGGACPHSARDPDHGEARKRRPAAPPSQIRYFLREPSSCKVQYQAKVKDLGEFSEEPDLVDWLTQYLTLTRCDLFFADKAVLIEGAAERLLLPAFMRKLDDGLDEAQHMLAAQYLTTVEVDGRHAHKFFPLVEFIGIPTLVVTDLDAEKRLPAKNGARNDDGTPKLSWQRSLVCSGTRSGNPCIKGWFETDDLQDIRARTGANKLKDDNAPTRIAFQMPETPGQPCGRSFEEALVLANPGRWPVPSEAVGEEAVEEWASGKAENLGKTSLALSLLGKVGEDGFVIPKYLREGLEWLRAVGAPSEHAAAVAPRVTEPLDAGPSDDPAVVTHADDDISGVAHDA